YYLYYAMTQSMSLLYFVEDLWSRFIHGHSLVEFTWFIEVILFLYATFYLAAKLVRFKILPMIILITLAVLLFAFIVYKLKFGNFWYDSILCFPLGLFWAWIEPQIIKYIRNWPIYISSISVTFVLFFVLFFQMKKLAPFSSLFLTTCIMLISYRLTLKNSFLLKVKKIGLEVYLY
ncbi:acyltransferase 3, partial [Lacticaseibacillus paracasei subsp. paracasei Lpp126]